MCSSLPTVSVGIFAAGPPALMSPPSAASYATGCMAGRFVWSTSPPASPSNVSGLGRRLHCGLTRARASSSHRVRTRTRASSSSHRVLHDQCRSLLFGHRCAFHRCALHAHVATSRLLALPRRLARLASQPGPSAVFPSCIGRLLVPSLRSLACQPRSLCCSPLCRSPLCCSVLPAHMLLFSHLSRSHMPLVPTRSSSSLGRRSVMLVSRAPLALLFRRRLPW